MNTYLCTMKYNTHTPIHIGSHFGTDSVFFSSIHTFTPVWEFWVDHLASRGSTILHYMYTLQNHLQSGMQVSEVNLTAFIWILFHKGYLVIQKLNVFFFLHFLCCWQQAYAICSSLGCLGYTGPPFYAWIITCMLSPETESSSTVQEAQGPLHHWCI